MRRCAGFAALLLLVAAVGVLPRLLGDANPDVLWLSYVGDRLLEGADLYTDIRETNPPLAVWSTVPAVIVAEALGLGASLVYGLMVFGAALCSIAAVGKILGRQEMPGDDRRGFLGVVTAALLMAPGLAFAQREHLTVILCLPYLFSRFFGGRSTRREEIAVGVFAGLGFALKPHFVLVPIVAEAWAWLTRRSSWRLFRPVTVSLGAVLGVYGAAVVVAEPDYLTVLRDLVVPFYPHYNPRPVTRGLASPSALVTGVGVVAGLFSLRRSGKPGSPVSGFAAVTVAWLAVAVSQRQGMSYHYLPAVSFSLLTLGAVLTVPGALPDRREAGGRFHPGGRPSGRTVVAGALALLVAGISYLHAPDLGNALGEDPDGYRQLRAAVEARVGDAPTLAALNLSFGDIYALVEDTDARWGIRYAGVWPIVAARRRATAGAAAAGDVLDGRTTDPLSPRSRAERAFRDEIVHDLIASDPDVLLVPRRPPGERRDRLDLLRYFCRDERFRRWFGAYELKAVISGQEVYVRTAEDRRHG